MKIKTHAHRYPRFYQVLAKPVRNNDQRKRTDLIICIIFPLRVNPHHLIGELHSWPCGLQ